MHDLESEVRGVTFLVENAERWRIRVERHLRSIDKSLEGILKADEIADAVAAKIDTQHTIRLTRVQRLAALLVAVVAFAGGIKGLWPA